MAKRKQPTNGSGDGEPAAVSTGADSDAAVADPGPATDGEQEVLPAPDLESEIAEARNEAASHLDDFLRARAELDNLRKRSARDIENAHKHGLERFMTELLPVKDSVELGLSAADGAEADADKLREGLELTLRLLNTASEKFGLEEVNPEGQSFDPEYHQAMSVQEVAGVEPGTVVTVVQKGYRLHARLLRPAMVIVAK